VLQQHETTAPVQWLASSAKSHISKTPGPGAHRLQNPKKPAFSNYSFSGQKCLETLYLPLRLQNCFLIQDGTPQMGDLFSRAPKSDFLERPT
jgi:hypothetical protein